MARFETINLTGMEPPDIIETLDYESILQELKDDFVARMTELGVDFDFIDLESDPAAKLLEVAADREVRLRARVNGAAKALLLAKAHRMDLEHLGAWFAVARLLVQEEVRASGSDAVLEPAIWEDDERLRSRVQLAPHAFSTAGPYGAYLFHTLTAAPKVKSVGIEIPAPGEVVVRPLTIEGDGKPTDDELDAIRSKLREDDVRPLTDVVTVASPGVHHIDVSVTLVVARGPDPQVLVDEAIAGIQEYAAARHKVGASFRLAGVFDAAYSPGVENVIINSPETDLDLGPAWAVFVENIDVEVRVVE